MADPEVRPIAIPLPQLPRDLDPKTLAYLTAYTRTVDENLRVLFRAMRGAGSDEELTYKSEVPALAPSVPLNVDFPLPSGIVWSVDGGIPKWTSGTVEYGGVVYNIPAWTGGDSTANSEIIHWNVATPTVFVGETTPSITPNKWVMAVFDGSVLLPAVSAIVYHGGLFQASTITTQALAAQAVTAGKIDIIDLFASNIQVTAGGKIWQNKSSYSSTTQGWFLGDDSGTAKLNIGGSTYYMKWTGTDLEVVSKTGFLGAGDNFYNIGTGELRVKGSFSIFKIVGGEVTIEDNSGNRIGVISQGYLAFGDVDNNADFTVNGALDLFPMGVGSPSISMGVSPAFTVSEMFTNDDFTADDPPLFRFRTVTTATNTSEIKSFELSKCRVGTDTPSTPLSGHLRMNSNVLEYYNGSTWVATS